MLRETKDFEPNFAAFTLVWVIGRPIVCDTIVICFSGISHFTALNSTSPSEPSLSPPAKKNNQSNIYNVYIGIKDIWRCFEYLATKKWRAQNMTVFFKFPISICFEWLLVGT